MGFGETQFASLAFREWARTARVIPHLAVHSRNAKRIITQPNQKRRVYAAYDAYVIKYFKRGGITRRA
jgi:hypothetical protein